ncbi:dihydroorotase [Planctomicrobium sp. SH664]|uniref:dihydroorotase n=1 Tax=Planctomicrobium sp. SH664 TaxID=3448125 RepID=UPI003F5B73F2
MLHRTLISNARCVLPEGVRQVDLLLEGERILAIDPPATARRDETIDARGLHVLPGVIDDQVHFREPGLEHKEDLQTGSWACARGGVTTFLEMPNTNPATVTLAALHDKLDRAASKSVVNYGFYIGATADNLDVLQQAQRTPGIKIFIGSSTGNLLVDEQSALERIFAETTLPICAHCEDESTVRTNKARFSGSTDVADHSRIRDHVAAQIATRRAVDLAIRHRHRFHVLHVSTAEEVAFLRGRPHWVTAEACPHHLFFQVEDYARLGTLVQMNPSIKTAADNAALWEGLRDGTIEVIATDHAPHTLSEKQQAYPQSPSGLPAVENSLLLMLDAAHRGLCTLEQVVEWMCAAPARVWSIARKGAIREGFDADLVLVDLQKTHTVRNAEQLTKSGWSPWDGVTLQGSIERTVVMGSTACVDGKIVATTRGQEATYDRNQ